MFSENKNKEEHTQTMAGGREKSRKQAKSVFKMRERYLFYGDISHIENI